MTGVTVPRKIERFYAIHEWRNALAVLVAAHPKEWNDVTDGSQEVQAFAERCTCARRRKITDRK